MMKKLIIIDRDDSKTLKTFPLNTISHSKPNRWIEIIEQLRVSKGDDIRKMLPAIIQMQEYYPS
jgi:hypothetical protein